MIQGKNIDIDIDSSIVKKKKYDDNTGDNVTNKRPPTLSEFILLTWQNDQKLQNVDKSYLHSEKVF